MFTFVLLFRETTTAFEAYERICLKKKTWGMHGVYSLEIKKTVKATINKAYDKDYFII